MGIGRFLTLCKRDEQQEDNRGKVCLANGEKYEIKHTQNLRVRDVCIEISKKLGIAPVALDFFTLMTTDCDHCLRPNHQVKQTCTKENDHYLNPKRLLHADECSAKVFFFRLAFKAIPGPDIRNIDGGAFQYFVMQCRWDYINGRILWLTKKDHLTLLVLESIIRGLENNVSGKDVLDNPKKYGLLHMFQDNEFSVREIKNHLKKQITQFMTCQENIDKAKSSFLSVLEGVEDFGITKIVVNKIYYNATISQTNHVEWEILISANGLKKRRTYKDEKDVDADEEGKPVSSKDETISDYKDIEYLEIKQSESDEIIHISRQQGFLEVISVGKSMIKKESLITLIEGFYRLLVNQYKMLTRYEPGLEFPMLNTRMKEFEIHGPIERKKAEALLKAVDCPNGDRLGVYMIRRSRQTFDSYNLSFISGAGEFKHYEIAKSPLGKYGIVSGPAFNSVAEFLEHYQTTQGGLSTTLKKYCPIPREALCALFDEHIVVEAPHPPSTSPPTNPEYHFTQIFNMQLQKLDHTFTTGSFGERIFKARCRKDNDGYQEVFCRRVVSSRSADFKERMIKCSEKMDTLVHRNLVQFYGICFYNDQNTCLALEWISSGTLDDYLNKEADVTVERLIMFAAQISEACMFLHQQNYVHGLLAAHNVLVVSDELVKLSDVSIPCLREQDLLVTLEESNRSPWKARECFQDRPYSKESDVWAFGVVLWEMFSKLKPFQNMTDDMILKVFQNEHHLACPRWCPEGLRIIMKSCWINDPSRRPTFVNIVMELRCVSQKLTPQEKQRKLPQTIDENFSLEPLTGNKKSSSAFRVEEEQPCTTSNQSNDGDTGRGTSYDVPSKDNEETTSEATSFAFIPERGPPEMVLPPEEQQHYTSSNQSSDDDTGGGTSYDLPSKDNEETTSEATSFAFIPERGPPEMVLPPEEEQHYTSSNQSSDDDTDGGTSYDLPSKDNEGTTSETMSLAFIPERGPPEMIWSPEEIELKKLQRKNPRVPDVQEQHEEATYDRIGMEESSFQEMPDEMPEASYRENEELPIHDDGELPIHDDEIATRNDTLTCSRGETSRDYYSICDLDHIGFLACQLGQGDTSGDYDGTSADDSGTSDKATVEEESHGGDTLVHIPTSATFQNLDPFADDSETRAALVFANFDRRTSEEAQYNQRQTKKQSFQMTSGTSGRPLVKQLPTMSRTNGQPLAKQLQSNDSSAYRLVGDRISRTSPGSKRHLTSNGYVKSKEYPDVSTRFPLPLMGGKSPTTSRRDTPPALSFGGLLEFSKLDPFANSAEDSGIMDDSNSALSDPAGVEYDVEEHLLAQNPNAKSRASKNMHQKSHSSSSKPRLAKSAKNDEEVSLLAGFSSFLERDPFCEILTDDQSPNSDSPSPRTEETSFLGKRRQPETTVRISSEKNQIDATSLVGAAAVSNQPKEKLHLLHGRIIGGGIRSNDVSGFYQKISKSPANPGLRNKGYVAVGSLSSASSGPRVVATPSERESTYHRTPAMLEDDTGPARLPIFSERDPFSEIRPNASGIDEEKIGRAANAGKVRGEVVTDWKGVGSPAQLGCINTQVARFPVTKKSEVTSGTLGYVKASVPNDTQVARFPLTKKSEVTSQTLGYVRASVQNDTQVARFPLTKKSEVTSQTLGYVKASVQNGHNKNTINTQIARSSVTNKSEVTSESLGYVKASVQSGHDKNTPSRSAVDEDGLSSAKSSLGYSNGLGITNFSDRDVFMDIIHNSGDARGVGEKSSDTSSCLKSTKVSSRSTKVSSNNNKRFDSSVTHSVNNSSYVSPYHLSTTSNSRVTVSNGEKPRATPSYHAILPPTDVPSSDSRHTIPGITHSRNNGASETPYQQSTTSNSREIIGNGEKPRVTPSYHAMLPPTEVASSDSRHTIPGITHSRNNGVCETPYQQSTTSNSRETISNGEKPRVAPSYHAMLPPTEVASSDSRHMIPGITHSRNNGACETPYQQSTTSNSREIVSNGEKPRVTPSYHATLPPTEVPSSDSKHFSLGVAYPTNKATRGSPYHLNSRYTSSNSHHGMLRETPQSSGDYDGGKSTDTSNSRTKFPYTVLGSNENRNVRSAVRPTHSTSNGTGGSPYNRSSTSNYARFADTYTVADKPNCGQELGGGDTGDEAVPGPITASFGDRDPFCDIGAARTLEADSKPNPSSNEIYNSLDSGQSKSRSRNSPVESKRFTSDKDIEKTEVDYECRSDDESGVSFGNRDPFSELYSAKENLIEECSVEPSFRTGIPNRGGEQSFDSENLVTFSDDKSGEMSDLKKEVRYDQLAGSSCGTTKSGSNEAHETAVDISSNTHSLSNQSENSRRTDRLVGEQNVPDGLSCKVDGSTGGSPSGDDGEEPLPNHEAKQKGDHRISDIASEYAKVTIVLAGTHTYQSVVTADESSGGRDLGAEGGEGHVSEVGINENDAGPGLEDNEETIVDPFNISAAAESIDNLDPTCPDVLLPEKTTGARKTETFEESMKSHLIPFTSLAFNDQEKCLGKGAFGVVRKAKLTRRAQHKTRPSTVVAVKCLKEGASEIYKNSFKQEAVNLMKLRNKFIVRFLGVSYDNEDKLLLVTELVPQGSLDNYLRDQKNLRILGNEVLLQFAIQITMGMLYLESKKLVHRDLAARNILVATESHVKISDFGLSRIYDDEYYRSRRENQKLPIRWLAPECLEQKKFTVNSDVWSLGVTLWEMFSYGERPYNNMSLKNASELIDYLKKGNQLEQPRACPDEVFANVKECWHLVPVNRITFFLLKTFLEEILKDKYSKKPYFM